MDNPRRRFCRLPGIRRSDELDDLSESPPVSADFGTTRNRSHIVIVYHATSRVASQVGFARMEYICNTLQSVFEITPVILLSKREKTSNSGLTTINTRFAHTLFEALNSRGVGAFSKGIFAAILTLFPFHFGDLSRILDKSNARCCIASGIYISLPVILVAKSRGATIFDDHNFEMRLAMKQLLRTKGSRMKAMSLAWLWYVSIVEFLSAHFADLVSVPTQSEAKDIRRILRIPESKVVVLPNPLPSSPSYPNRRRSQERTLSPSQGQNQVLFVGDMTYGPNREAAEWILNGLAPALKLLNNRIEILLAGRGTNLLTKSPSDNVRILGFVPDIAETITRAAVCISPVAYSGGTQNKVIHYMSLGRPIVATHESIRGLEGCKGIIVAEREQFPEVIELLVENKPYSDFLSKASSAYYEVLQRTTEQHATVFGRAVSRLVQASQLEEVN